MRRSQKKRRSRPNSFWQTRLAGGFFVNVTKLLKAILVVVPALGITALMYRQALESRDKAVEQHRRAAEAAEHRPHPITIPPEYRDSSLNSLVYSVMDENKRYFEKL